MPRMYVAPLLAISLGVSLVASAPAAALGASAGAVFNMVRLTCAQPAHPTQGAVMAADPSQYCTSAATAQTVTHGPAPVSTLPAPVCVSMAALPQAVAAGMFAVATGGVDSSLVPSAPLACVPGAMRALASSGQNAAPQRVRTPSHAASGSARQGRARHATTAAALNLPAYAPLGAQSTDGSTGSDDMLGLIVKFVVVMALLFLCLRVLKAIMPKLSGPRGAPSHGIVLHTESIGAKQTVQFLDLGVRILVVSTTGAAVTPLTSIDDAAEMETIRATYRPAAPTTTTSTTASPDEPRPSRPTFAQALAASMASLNRPNRTAGAKSSHAPVSRALAENDVADLPDDGDPVVARALDTVRGLREGVRRS